MFNVPGIFLGIGMLQFSRLSNQLFVSHIIDPKTII